MEIRTVRQIEPPVRERELVICVGFVCKKHPQHMAAFLEYQTEMTTWKHHPLSRSGYSLRPTQDPGLLNYSTTTNPARWEAPTETGEYEAKCTVSDSDDLRPKSWTGGSTN